MGSWSVNCGISNIAITSGNKCVILPLKKQQDSETREWQPAALPIFGEYNDYGGMEEIEKDDNTEFIENHFGISIEDFVVFLVDGKFTYERDEAKEVAGRMKSFKEAESWRFMWIDRQVYDFMILNHDEYHKGYMDYGASEMLEKFGFKLVEKSDELQNYDSKRFNQLWKKGELEIFSDGRTILTKDNRYVYHYGKGDESSIETYFEVPAELEYLKNKSKDEAWRVMDISKAKTMLGRIIGSRYDFEEFSFLKKVFVSNTLHKKYIQNIEKFGDRLVHLINISHNLHPMSGQFCPHVLHLTPQCGEYAQHQILLDKFSQINKSYLAKYD